MGNTARIKRYLHGNINLLNILLIIAITATIVFAVLPLLRMKTTVGLPVVTAKVVSDPPAAEKPPPPTPLDYALIGENNLFHPERRIPPLKKEEKSLPKPELVLYGTVLAGDVVLAFVEDKKSPKTTPGRGQRQAVIKKGDVLSGFVLKKIETDHIVLTRGEEVMAVHLSVESKKRNTGGAPGAPGPQGAAPLSRAYQSPPAPAAAARAQRPAPAPAPPPVTRRPLASLQGSGQATGGQVGNR